MNIKKLALTSAITAIAINANAWTIAPQATITFDGQQKNGSGIVMAGTVGAGTSGTTTIAGDVSGMTLGFGDFDVTTGYSNNFNLAGTSFSTSNIVFSSTRRVYQDINPGNGGLGAYTGSNKSGDTDNLNSNLGSNAKFDEVLFFDFKADTLLNTVFLTVNIKNLPPL